MIKTESARHWLISTALSYLGTPYIWRGDDPSGFDCSGFVIECLKSVGLLQENEDYSAERLFHLYINKTSCAGRSTCDAISSRSINHDAEITPHKGSLLFYKNKNNHVFHVTICLDRWFQIGAFGGDSDNTTSDKSWRDNAFVKIRPIGKLGQNMVLIDPFKSDDN